MHFSSQSELCHNPDVVRLRIDSTLCCNCTFALPVTPGQNPWKRKNLQCSYGYGEHQISIAITKLVCDKSSTAEEKHRARRFGGQYVSLQNPDDIPGDGSFLKLPECVKGPCRMGHIVALCTYMALAGVRT